MCKAWQICRIWHMTNLNAETSCALIRCGVRHEKNVHAISKFQPSIISCIFLRLHNIIEAIWRAWTLKCCERGHVAIILSRRLHVLQFNWWCVGAFAGYESKATNTWRISIFYTFSTSPMEKENLTNQNPSLMRFSIALQSIHYTPKNVTFYSQQLSTAVHQLENQKREKNENQSFKRNLYSQETASVLSTCNHHEYTLSILSACILLICHQKFDLKISKDIKRYQNERPEFNNWSAKRANNEISIEIER